MSATEQEGTTHYILDYVSLIETAVVISFYSFLMISTYRQVGFKSFGFREHFTVWSFFFVEFANLSVFIWVVITKKHSLANILDLSLG